MLLRALEAELNSCMAESGKAEGWFVLFICIDLLNYPHRNISNEAVYIEHEETGFQT